MSSAGRVFSSVIHYLISQSHVLPGFREQFRPQERGPHVAARNLNAAFLIAISGSRLSHPARGYLASMSADPHWGDTAGLYLDAVGRVEKEMESTSGRRPVAVAWLRLAVPVAAMFCEGSGFTGNDAEELVRAGARRLGKAPAGPGGTRVLPGDETGAGLFGPVIDALEKEIFEGDWFAGRSKEQALALVRSWRRKDEMQNAQC